jgi:hypothetical protein
VGLRYGEEKNLDSPDSNSDPSVVQPVTSRTKVKFTLRQTISQSAHRGFEPTLGLVASYCFLSEG